ncbi:MAG: ABC transporter ATP-binding protein [Fimbriimonadia bacterium]|jgi:subfamily B ATP-binding cassette protein MsbA
MSVERRVIRMVLAEWRPLALALLCTAGVAGITFAIAKLIEHFVDLATHQDIAGLDRLMIFVAAVAFANFLFARGQMYYMALAAQSMTKKLRAHIFEHLQQMPISYFQRKHAGSLQSTITNDAVVVENGMRLVRDFVSAPLMLVGGCVYLLILNWRLALAALVAMPFMLLIVVNRGRKVRRITRELQDRIGGFVHVLEESLRGVRVIKAFGMENHQIERFDDANESAFRTAMYAQKKISTIKPMLELIGTVGIALVLWIGGRDVAQGVMTGGELMGFLFVAHQMVTAAGGVGNMNATRAQVLAAADRIYREVLDVQSDVRDKPDAKPLPPIAGHIEFDNVSFRYADGTQALSNVSFTVKPGETVAIVGESGAGKSTLADLLLRFYDPTEGRIFIDSYDLRDITAQSLRAQIGVVPQSTLLFSGTIADNIRMGRPNATDQEVEQAAEAAHLAAHLFRGRTNGAAEGLQASATDLSGGERQRVAIARALVRNPRILLLDEATSALDSVSERSIQEAIESNRHQRTLIVIAHRLSTAARADRIVVLRAGRLVEEGNHSELLARDGEYARLYAAYVHGTLEAVLPAD